jgi:hypothetical protein
MLWTDCNADLDSFVIGDLGKMTDMNSKFAAEAAATGLLKETIRTVRIAKLVITVQRFFHRLSN